MKLIKTIRTMETLKVKPVFINANFDSKVGFYNDKMCYSEFDHLNKDWKNKTIILISEDSVINKGDIVFRTDTLTTHETNTVTDGFVGIINTGGVNKKLCKNVIATQNDMSPQLIINLIDEYNKTGKMNDIVVGIKTLHEGQIIPRYTMGYITVIEENNIQNIKGWYYISNLDNQIHNVMDSQCNIIEHDDWTEISIINDDGCEIDSCAIYKSLQDLLVAIN